MLKTVLFGHKNLMVWLVIQVVLYEGWMLGFKPRPVESVKAVDPQLETVNKNLEAYYDAWDKFINAWIVIKIKDPKCVYQWRLQVGTQSNMLSYKTSVHIHCYELR